MVVFYVGPLLVSSATAPHCSAAAFLGQLLFVAAWEVVAVALYCAIG